MPKPNWNKKTISTYITEQQKEVWKTAAKAERKAIADFIRDRVDSTINNHNQDGKTCIWLEIPKELQDKAENENAALDELIQYHIYRILKVDADKELLWEQSPSSPDIDSFKAKNIELERKIQVLNAEMNNLRTKDSISSNNEIFKVLEKKKFLTLEQLAESLNRGTDDDAIHFLYEEIEIIMTNIGMIEYKPGFKGGGYRFNPDIEPIDDELPTEDSRIYTSTRGVKNETK
jgi:hypothetical protein